MKQERKKEVKGGESERGRGGVRWRGRKGEGEAGEEVSR